MEHEARLPAYSLEPGFWEDAGLIEAIDKRDLGRLLRAYRHHPSHGQPLKQEVLAKWAGCSQAAVSRIELGRQGGRKVDALERWASVLCVPTHLRWWPPLPPSPRATPLTDLPHQVSPPAAPEDDVHRGQFLTLAGKTVGVALLTPPLLLPRQGGGSPRVNEDTIGALATEIVGHRWRDRTLGAHALLPTTLQRAHAITRLAMELRDTHPCRAAAVDAAADLSHLVGYQLYDQGVPGRATTWFRASAELAARARNADLYVFAMTGVASMATQMDQPQDALTLLEQLSQIRLSAAGKSYVAAYQAHALARQRDVDSALRLLDDATEHAEQAAHQPPSSLIGIDHHTWMKRQEALILARANSPAAVPILEYLRARTEGTFVRYHANLATDLASLHEDADEAADLLVTAVRINGIVKSAERRDRITTVLDQLRYRGADHAVQRVEEALHAHSTT